jgi:predicted regulator of Ras-like GTPase activity (Roadblock/LC7/MglB family)
VSVALHKDPGLIAHGTAVLAGMRELCSSLVYAALVTDDGFEVIRLPEAADGGRFASMASSMQALGDAVARELQIGAGEFIIIASEHGHVVQLRVPGEPLVLSALFDNDETLGMALSISRQSAERLSTFVSAARS